MRMCPVGRYFYYKTRKGQIPEIQLPIDVAPGHKLGSLHNHYADHSEHPRSQDQALNVITPMGKDGGDGYLVNARMTFAEMCRKKMDAMNDKESTRTMNGSLKTK